MTQLVDAENKSTLNPILFEKLISCDYIATLGLVGKSSEFSESLSWFTAGALSASILRSYILLDVSAGRLRFSASSIDIIDPGSTFVILPGSLLSLQAGLAVLTMLSLIPMFLGYFCQSRYTVLSARRIVQPSFFGSIAGLFASSFLMPYGDLWTTFGLFIFVIPVAASVTVLNLVGAVMYASLDSTVNRSYVLGWRGLSIRVMLGAFLGTLPGLWIVYLISRSDTFSATIWTWTDSVNSVYVPLSLLMILVLPYFSSVGSSVIVARRSRLGGFLLLACVGLLTVRLIVLFGYASNWSFTSIVQGYDTSVSLSRLTRELAFMLALNIILLIGAICGISTKHNESTVNDN